MQFLTRVSISFRQKLCILLWYMNKIMMGSMKGHYNVRPKEHDIYYIIYRLLISLNVVMMHCICLLMSHWY